MLKCICRPAKVHGCLVIGLFGIAHLRFGLVVGITGITLLSCSPRGVSSLQAVGRLTLQKGPLGHDRLRTWSEGGKRGRMFIYFVGLILASYVRSVWQKDDVLRKKFSSTEAVLAEMRTIRCIPDFITFPSVF